MTDMEDKDISNCDFESDTPIYVGQGPKAEQDDNDMSCKVIDIPVENSDGSTHAQSDLGQDEKQGTSRPATSLVNNKEQTSDELSFDPQQTVESCQALKTSLPETFCLSKSHADTFDWTRDSGCNWVDEYSDKDDDDDEIRVGHEGKKAESPLRIEVLKCRSNGNCEIGMVEDHIKMECSSTGKAENSSMDCRSSASNVTQSELSSRCETLSGNYLDRTCNEDVKKCCESEDLSCKNKNSETFDEQEHQRLSASELQTSSNVSKYEKVECQSCDMVEHSPADKPYSLRTRRRNTSFQEDILKSKPKTPSKKSTGASCKDPKTTCKEYEKKEGISLPVTRRTSPRKRNRIDQVEDHSSIKTVPLVCDQNLNSKTVMIVEEQEKNNSLHGQEKSSTSRSILDQGPGLSSDSEVVDCELDSSNVPVSSQIFTGAPIFSCSKTKTRKQNCRGKGSTCQTHENVSAAGEGMPLDADDAYKKEILEPEPGHEGEKRTSNENQSIHSDLNQACGPASSPSNDVLKTSNRPRRRKQSYQEQSKTVVTDYEQIAAETGEEDKTLKRTRRVNKNCEPSKKQKNLGNKDDVIDSQTLTSYNVSVEIPLQTAHSVVNGGSIPCAENDKEAPNNIGKLDGPTPPVKRPVYRARRCRSRARKSANDLINILTAASVSALKRVSESVSPPSKENQESVQTDQKVSSKKGRSSSRKGRVIRARQSRKRKYPCCSPGEDDAHLSDSVKVGRDEMNSSCKKADEPNNLTSDVGPSPEKNAVILRLGSVSHDDGGGDDDGGDDDDELMNPVLTPDSKTKDLPPAFSVNDVVWAPDPGDKSRWPAVVVEVAGENVSRRVYNVFKTNQAKEHYFQVKSSRYLKPYNCREKETYMEKGKGITEFKKAVEKANDFIMKIGLGKVNSYEDFFKPSDAYLDSPPPSPDYTSPPSPPLIVGHSSPEYPLHCRKTSQHVIDVDDDDDDEDEEEEEDKEGGLNDSLNSVKSHCNGTSKEITRLKRKWQRKEKRLLEHMRSLQTKEYLVGIQHGKVASHRHQWFLSTNPSDKGRLLRGSFGALINEKKRFETVNYLRDLLISDKSLLSSPRYMMEVALPEALNFAYQKTFRVSKDEAEKLIHMDGQQVIRDLDIG